ncbi:hypothetical protein N9I08_00850 [Candidatus Pelagibacter sp.]|jgi:hypothetical protein|nr:hypothetical protein [Candidatus Pelagibacter sp.]
MIKKLILISIFCILLLSCGKKAHPEYEGNEIILKCGLNDC